MSSNLREAHDLAWLRQKSMPQIEGAVKIRVADIFSGCGLMSLGVAEACRALGLGFDPVIAIDSNLAAAATYSTNFPRALVLPIPIESYVERNVGDALSNAEKELVANIGKIDILVGGPPCQGHSDLNNHTRRRDSRNALFMKMARFAELVRPQHVIIENVSGILHDESDVQARTREAFIRLGYHVDAEVLEALKFGVAQRRKRFVMIASRRALAFSDFLHAYHTSLRTFSWACGDLDGVVSSEVFDSAPSPSNVNRERIRHLFRENLYDLPNSRRPDCHRLKRHSYVSTYGRLRWDQPSQTITTGFGSMGQGRYVHPLRERTITPHEAARLQFIPDHFHFETKRRTALAEMIGNGVPPKLTYMVALELLR